MTLEYIEPIVARDMPGLRLALTAHMPAPYSMSARAILDLKKVGYVPVNQVAAGANEVLQAWTGHRNAPVAVYENEAPRTGWLEILHLAERLGKGPSLIPSDLRERMLMIGLINELIGEDGWIWNLRVLMLGMVGPERAAKGLKTNPMYAQYGYSEAAQKQAGAKAREILDMFTSHLKSQRDRGSHYVIGEALSAADIYWACFSLLAKTLPADVCAIPAGLRKSYDLGSEAIGGCDPILIEQRDWVFENHLSLPMTF
ncbi:MAG: glutathione binding-like protein [Proteobacteria bacterium]|nr:glutathione binding-like protein [Pseudomonadota bacterium]